MSFHKNFMVNKLVYFIFFRQVSECSIVTGIEGVNIFELIKHAFVDEIFSLHN